MFPFDKLEDSEELYNIISRSSIEAGSIASLNLLPPPETENRILQVVKDSGARLDLNNVAEHIGPALNNALYSDAILSSEENLRNCFVATESRVKFDSLLGMHLADPKPSTVLPAERIRTDREGSGLEKIIRLSNFPDYAPPVTLVIGPVGAGKSTYLKHFELVSGKSVLSSRPTHWVYVDFEGLGKAGDPRKFLYDKLLAYLNAQDNIDFRSVIEPAYSDLIAALARGHYKQIYLEDKTEFNKVVANKIDLQYTGIEPYVDRIFSYLSKNSLCVIVLDNVDLYEDDRLETALFSEGLALSKRIFSHVIISIRDRTFVQHKNSPVFDAYDLRRLWLDPPPIASVIKKRLTYSKKILEGKSVEIIARNNFKIKVPNLSVFFDIVQSSISNDTAGEFISSISDTNIRKGLGLIVNFLKSGHVQADRALKNYISGNYDWRFLFDEVFKGCVLSQWKHFKESRSECTNLFDSDIHSKRLRLLRIHLLGILFSRARSERTIETPMDYIFSIFVPLGASQDHIINTMSFFYRNGLVRSTSATDITNDSILNITKNGGYYINDLCNKMVYLESCMYDTAIENQEVWGKISSISRDIESNSTRKADRLELRRDRLEIFTDYLKETEADLIEIDESKLLKPVIPLIAESVLREAEEILRRASNRSSRRR